MSIKLKIILIIIMILFLIYICWYIKNKKISIKNSLLWVIADIGVIFCILFINPLLKITNFIGIKKVSNLMFFIGFIFLLVLCFKQSTQLSNLNKKVINLTQELGILKNNINKDKKKYENKKK